MNLLGLACLIAAISVLPVIALAIIVWCGTKRDEALQREAERVDS
jgi:hypothetical protein